MDDIKYFTNDEMEAVIKGWAVTYPNLVNLQKIGESHEKRPLWLMAITNRSTGEDDDKPAVWLDANIHATEITGTSVTLYITGMLLENYGKDEHITRLLDSSTYYIMPRINPDGAALAMAPNPRFVRSGVRPYPYPEKQDGLHEQDIDGDGRILQMRIPDPSGDWKISSLDPRLMEKRAPDELGGTYYRILSEGLIENYDGWIIQEAPALQGLDFNRNFPFEWRPEGTQPGAGPFPASEPEIHAVVEFISNHPNINLAVTYHTFSGVILRPFSTKADSEMDTGDLWIYQKIGKRGTDLTGYRNVSVFHDFLYHPKEVTTGAFDDWLYDHLGMFAFTIELWDLPTAAGIKERKFIEWFRDHPHQQDVDILNWAEEQSPGCYIPWYSFNHPQLGQVELGGWDVFYTWRNPPFSQLAAEVTRNVPFALALGDMLPHCSILDFKASPLDDNRTGTQDGTSFHINLVLENTGYLPSKQGKTRSAMRPIQVELDLPEGATFIQGKPRLNLGHMEGRSNLIGLGQQYAFSSTDNRARVEWVVRAAKPGTIQVKILCPRGGNIKRDLALS
jgi:murein tripeptide amidase MpaA